MMIYQIIRATQPGTVHGSIQASYKQDKTQGSDLNSSLQNDVWDVWDPGQDSDTGARAPRTPTRMMPRARAPKALI